MSQTTLLALQAVESFGYIVFWVFMLPAVLKYRIFSPLPSWLRISIGLAMFVGGIAGIALHFVK